MAYTTDQRFEMHPAVAFASVMLGAALFGVAGAVIAVPVAAMAIGLVEARQLRHEVPDEEPQVEIESEPEM